MELPGRKAHQRPISFPQAFFRLVTQASKPHAGRTTKKAACNHAYSLFPHRVGFYFFLRFCSSVAMESLIDVSAMIFLYFI